MNSKAILEFFKAMKKIIIMIGVLILLAIIVFVGVRIKKLEERERLEAFYDSEVENLMEDFKATYPDLSFEITHKLLIDDNGDVMWCVYYIDGDDTLEDFFRKKEKYFYNGFSSLASQGMIEHIIIYINGEEWTECRDWYKELEDAKRNITRTCRVETCYNDREGSSDYCQFHKWLEKD